jgi:uncharacterized membrane protein YsdA (DUF1294 family)/cold shock CspA family protein
MAAPKPKPAGARSTGTVAEWFDDRGYGFIEAEGGERLFFHISEVRERYARARIGDRVTFAMGLGRNGKPAAVDVDVAGVNPRPREALERGTDKPFARESYRVYAGFALIVLVILATVLDRAPIWLAVAYLVMGALSAVVYASDKRSAETNTWRTREATLHAVDLAFGIIGGLLAQHIFRHKTAKTTFAVVTAAIAVLHLVGLGALAAGTISPQAMEALLGALMSESGSVR